MSRAKEDLRRRHLARLATLNRAAGTAAGEAISRQLLERAEVAGAPAVAAYAAMPGEPDLAALLQAVIERGQALFLPAWDPAARQYTLRLTRTLGDLRPGHYDILEPPATATRRLPDDDSLLWLVPGVAFDAAGHRLGRGGGYYDRLLATFNGTKIGIAYDWQLVPDVPTEPHDMRLDAVATERRFIAVAAGVTDHENQRK